MGRLWGGLALVAVAVPLSLVFEGNAFAQEWKFTRSDQSSYAEYYDDQTGLGFHFSCSGSGKLEIALTEILMEYTVSQLEVVAGTADVATKMDIHG